MEIIAALLFVVGGGLIGFGIGSGTGWRLRGEFDARSMADAIERRWNEAKRKAADRQGKS